MARFWVGEFRAYHVEEMELDDEERERVQKGRRRFLAIEAEQSAYTIFDENHPIMVGGAVTLWGENKALWGLFSQKCNGSGMLFATRATKRFIAGLLFRRLESHVRCGFQQGERLNKLLGFTLECERMRCFLPDGGDASMWVIVR